MRDGTSYKKAVLLQGGPRDAAVDFDTPTPIEVYGSIFSAIVLFKHQRNP